MKNGTRLPQEGTAAHVEIPRGILTPRPVYSHESTGRLHADLLEACRLLNVDVAPELYVRQDPRPNAYTMAVQGQRPFVVVTTALLDLLEPREVQAVIAHELGHLKCEHGLFLLLSNLLTSVVLGGTVLGAALQT